MNGLYFLLSFTLILSLILTVYYFNELEKYCKTDNQECLDDPKREKIINTTIILLIYSFLIMFINDKSKSILDKLKQFKVALFISVLLVLIISIYRIYIVFQYMKQLKDKCECKEYTIEYFIIKYHNFYQILGIVIMMILSIISLIMLFRLKKNLIK